MPARSTATLQSADMTGARSAGISGLDNGFSVSGILFGFLAVHEQEARPAGQGVASAPDYPKLSARKIQYAAPAAFRGKNLVIHGYATRRIRNDARDSTTCPDMRKVISHS
jgi:hypothetical protein